MYCIHDAVAETFLEGEDEVSLKCLLSSVVKTVLVVGGSHDSCSLVDVHRPVLGDAVHSADICCVCCVDAVPV